ncbi:MAG: T9SS C-terminal target domain-containing protein [Calditrichaeota bacterium]|nr:MAG: T9SS C-terminal target domain-containing protein [Calditrichota bacterium]MBL1205695.1 T9SS C-terminal target domain-containing protein [Calditrichota bacterium]NOG45523.1 T9SS type A sorting domain-containing protein [Calditrichota bacterium]
MKRAIFLLLNIFFSSILIAGNNPELTKKNPKWNKTPVKSFPVNQNVINKTNSDIFLGATLYDYSESPIRLIARSEKGLHMAYMKTSTEETSQDITYDFLSNNTSAFLGNYKVTGNRTTALGNITTGADNQALIAVSNNGISIWRDSGEAQFSFLEDTIFTDDGNIYSPRIDVQGNSIVVSLGNKIAYSANNGSTWTFQDWPQNPNTDLVLGNLANEVLIDPTNHNRLVSVYTMDDTTEAAAGEGLYLAVSENAGQTWTNELIVDEKFHENGRQFLVENFAQLSSALDGQGHLHVAFNGYGREIFGKDTVFVFSIGYWNDVIREVIETAKLDTALTDQILNSFPGNGIGQAYPSIAVGENGDKVAIAFQGPEIDEEMKIVFALDFPSDSLSEYMSTNIMMVTSAIDTHQKPFGFSDQQYIGGTYGWSDVFPSVSRRIDAENNFELLYLEDYSPGVSLFLEGSDAHSDWVTQGVSILCCIDILGIDKTNPLNDFHLSQNYPNPFNPSTIIRYTLNKKSTVLLEVYDTNGRKIKTLVKDRQPPGLKNVTFDGTSLSSGVYFYQLRINGRHAQSRKMLLIR